MIDNSWFNRALFSKTPESIAFLNEVISRFPDALSFAPGASHPRFFEEINLQDYLATFKNFLITEKKMSSKEANESLYQYGASAGIINDLLARVLSNDRGIEVSPQSIVVTSGAQEAFILVLNALFGDTPGILVTTDPFYIGIPNAAAFLDIPITYLDQDHATFNLRQLEEICKKSHEQGEPVKAFILGTDFSNPSGTRLSLAERQELLHLASVYDFFIIEDNTYAFTGVDSPQRPSLKSLDGAKKVIAIETLSKICLPGVRVGYIIADQVVVKPDGTGMLLAQGIARLKGMNTLNTSPICQGIVGGMIIQGNNSLRKQEKAKGEFYAKQLRYLLLCLNDLLPEKIARKSGVSWNTPEGGFFIRVKLPVKANTELLEMCATHFGVLWTPMSFFSHSERCSYEIRLSCSYLEEHEIREGVSRLVDFFLSLTKPAHSKQQSPRSTITANN